MKALEERIEYFICLGWTLYEDTIINNLADDSSELI